MFDKLVTIYTEIFQVKNFCGSHVEHAKMSQHHSIWVPF